MTPTGTTEPLGGVAHLDVPALSGEACWVLRFRQDIPFTPRKSRLEIAALLSRLGEPHGLPILAGCGTGRQNWGLLLLLLGHA